MHSESKNRRYVDSPKNLKEHLVPELCTKINFPALYWLKATTLPSILHRILQLLIAEDLRCLIAKETNLGLLSNNKWPPLVITEEEREDSFEPLLETSTMENDNLQSEPVLDGPEIDGILTFYFENSIYLYKLNFFLQIIIIVIIVIITELLFIYFLFIYF